MNFIIWILAVMIAVSFPLIIACMLLFDTWKERLIALGLIPIVLLPPEFVFIGFIIAVCLIAHAFLMNTEQ